MHSVVIRICGTIAATAALIYTMALVFSALDPDGIRMSARVNAILLTIIGTATLVAVNGWQARASAREAVGTAVTVKLEQLLYRVAEQTAGTAHDQLVAAIREVAHGVSADLTDSLGAKVETWLGRSHTQGMIDESRPGATLASINGRREV
jgi:hypothetical protein